MRKLLFNSLAILICSSSIAVSTVTASGLEKTFTWKYPVNKDGAVVLENYDCDIVVHTWDKGETEFRLAVNAATRSEEDGATLDKYLQNLKFTNSPASVRFNSIFWKNRNTINGRSTIELGSGIKISLTEFSMSGELWIPSGCKFELDSKYSTITMENFMGRLSLNLYNDNVYGEKLDGSTMISDKYSTIEFKDIKDLTADLYNSKLSVGNSGSLKIESKYSKFTALTSGTLDLNCYTDKYSFTRTGDITITAKYTDLKTETSGKLNIDYYDGSIVTTGVNDVKLTSKYADFEFGNAGNITVVSSYNDKLTGTKINSLTVEESKYTSYKIDEILSSVTEQDGYEDKFTILKAGAELREFAINGKYIDISLGLPKSYDFRLKSRIQYPKLDFDESLLKTRTKIVKDTQFEYEGVKGTERDAMPVVEVNGYQVSLKINWL